jgi:DNA polymerase III subunit beta
MHIRINKEELIPALAKIQGITGRTTQLAITQAVLLVAEKPTGSSLESITITATDLDTGYECYCDAEILIAGRVAINSKKLFEIVKAMAGETVNILESQSRWVEITDGQSVYHLVSADPDNFPDLISDQGFLFCEIDAASLKDLAEKASRVPWDATETRPHLAGALMVRTQNDEKEDILQICSQNGISLGLATCVLGQGELGKKTADNKLLIHKRGLLDLVKCIGDHTGKIILKQQENRLVALSSSDMLVVRLLEGEFPDISNIFHSNSIEPTKNFAFETERDKFLDMIGRMSVMTSPEYPGASFRLSQKTLHINITNPELGECSETIAVDYEGDGTEINFNPRLFGSLVKIIHDKRIRVCMKGPDKPCLIDGTGDMSFRAVIMPLRK